ncbi:MAG: MFS transporter [Xenophilus sp.]
MEVGMVARPPRFYGWFLVWVLAAIVGINFGFCYTGASVTNASMAAEMGLSRSMLGLGFTAFVLMVGCSAPVSARLVNRYGPRRTLALGSMLVALGALLLTLVVDSGWRYVAVYGGVVAMGSGLGALIPAQSCVTNWFIKRRGIGLAIVLTGSGLAGSIAAPLINQAIVWNGGGWRGGWYCVLAAACVSFVLALAFVRDRPEQLGQRPDGVVPHGDTTAEAIAAGAPQSWTLKRTMRTRAYWLIGLAAVGETVPSSAVLAHGVPHLRDLGHSPEAAASAISLFALSSVFGKLSAGYLCDRFNTRHMWTVFILVLSVAVLTATHARGMPMMVLFAVLLGLGAGGSLTCWHATVAHYYGPESFATVLGSQMPFTNAFAALSPFLTGLAFDRLGTYKSAFYAMAVLGALLAILVLLAPPAQPPRRVLAGTT